MIFLLSFVLCALSSWGVSHYATQLKLIDHPSRRSSHYLPTPKGGGVGLLIVFVTVSATAVPISFWLPGALLSLFSLLNDISEIQPVIRLLAQFFAAGTFLLGIIQGGYWDLSFTNSLLLFGFLLLFIVATANFYNFMDGINGIAGLMGIVSFGLLGAYQLSIDSDLYVLCFSMSAGCFGFLLFNIPTAKVFLGDVGSILLGYVFAVVVVATATDIHEFIVLASFLLVFYLDECLSICRRLKEKQSLMRAHRSHLYQILSNEGGVAHWKVALGYALLQLLIGILIFWLHNYGLLWLGVFLLSVSFIYASVDLYIRRWIFSSKKMP